jgi:HEAT repeat protein
MIRCTLILAFVLGFAAAALPARAADPDLAVALLLLESKNTSTKLFALDELQALGPKAKEAAPRIRELLKDPDATVRLRAAIALGKMGEEALPGLIEAIQHADSQVRLAGIEAVEQRGAAARPAVPALKAALIDAHGPIRLAAARALWRIDQSDAGLPLLSESLKSRDPNEVAYAIEVLAEVGAKAVPAVLVRLRDESSPIRAAAAQTLARMGPAAGQTIPQLRAALQDPEPEVVVAVLRAIQALGPDGKPLVNALYARLSADDPWVAALAAEILYMHGVRSPAIVAGYFAPLRSGDRRTREATLQRIRRLSPETLPYLELLDPPSKDPNILQVQVADVVVAHCTEPQLLRLAGRRLGAAWDADMARRAGDEFGRRHPANTVTLFTRVAGFLDPREEVWLAVLMAQRDPDASDADLAFAIARCVQEYRPAARAAVIIERLALLRLDAVISVMAHFLECGETHTRRAAARYAVFARALFKPLAPVLEARLGDPDPATRANAALALWNGRQDRKALALLLDVLGSGQDDELRTEVAWGLAAADPKPKEALPALVRLHAEAARKCDERLRVAAFEAIRRIDPDEAFGLVPKRPTP